MKFIRIIILLISVPLQAQTLTGSIVNYETGQPVPFATVYINGSTKGTISARDGRFELINLTYPCELVVSHVSYQPSQLTLTKKPVSEISISVHPKLNEIVEVKVVDKNLRASNLQRFKDGLLGFDAWGEDAVLLNDSVLSFNNAGKKEITREDSLIGERILFKVKAAAPLKIDMPKLGYELQYDLIRFIEKYNIDQKLNIISILGYRYYKPKNTSSPRQQKRFARNRLKAYYFSPQHFTRSLYENSLEENGYEIYYDSVKNNIFQWIRFYPDSCNCMTYLDGGAIITGFKNQYLIIKYYKNVRERPVNLNERHSENLDYIISAIYFPGDTCLIRANGSVPGNYMVFDEFLGSKRLGASLPDEYLPAVRGKKRFRIQNE